MKRLSGGSAVAADASVVAIEQAAALHQAGRIDAAEAAYLALLKGSSAQRRGVLPLLGLLYRQGARLTEALAAYDQLLATGDRSGETFLIRGDLLHGLRRNLEALQSYDRALACAPGRPDILNNRGVALVALGRPTDALASYDAALNAAPEYAEALFNRGVVLADLDRPEAALESYARAAAMRPDHARAHNNLGLLLAGTHRLAEALESYDRAVAAAPDYAEALNNRSACLRLMRRLDAALDSADLALAQRAAYPEALNSRGLALAALTRFDAALESYDQALALRANYPEALSNSGVALVSLGRPEAALARYDAALAVDPTYAEAEFNAALTLLRLGRYESGWRRHEARHRRRGEPLPFSPAKLWLGEEDVSGQTVLAHAEQGLGDTLQFCRFAPAVAALGARVVLKVQPALQSLLTGMEGVDRVISIHDKGPAFDRHVPLMSLPRALGTTLETIPSEPYLTAAANLTAAWEARLGRRDRLRMGLVWSGNPAHENDHNRSVALSALSTLADVDVELISLQKVVKDSDAAWRPHMPSLRWVLEDHHDFADTAALVSTCDLIISVDTAVAHLAGALGRPVWILTPRISDWRWMVPSSDFVQGLRAFDSTPWYPIARLYRQRQLGDWSGVVATIAVALRQEAARFRAAP